MEVQDLQGAHYRKCHYLPEGHGVRAAVDLFVLLPVVFQSIRAGGCRLNHLFYSKIIRS